MGLMGRIYLLIALAVVPAFALLAYIHFQEHQQAEAEAEAQALRSARLVSGELEQTLQSVQGVLSTAAAAPTVHSLQEPACTEYLRRLEEINPSAGIIAVATADGTTRCGGTPGADLSDRPYFQAALGSEQLVIGEYAVGRASKAPVLPVAIRTVTTEGPAVIATGLRLDWLREHFIQRHPELPPNSSLTITDRNGMILVRLPNREREGTPLSRYPVIAEAETGGTFRSTADVTADGIARFMGFTPPAEGPAAGLAVAVGFPQAPILAELRARAMRNYFLLGLIALLTFIAAALGGQLFIQRPASHLLAVIGTWRSGSTGARTNPESLPREFARIGSAFNTMAAELETALHHKNVLLKEINHRVMNSLATMGSLLKMQSKNIPDPASQELFDNAIGRIDALALVYRRMQPVEGVDAVDFAAFLHELCRDLHASMMGSGTPCLVEADSLRLSPAQAAPLTLIVNELMTNALKHGSGQVGPIRVTLRRSETTCRIAVRNPGVLAAGYDLRRTERFGMKMVGAMVQQLRGELEVTSADGETEFAVNFTPAFPQPVLADHPESASKHEPRTADLFSAPEGAAIR